MSYGQPVPDHDFEEVLLYLKESRGFDFTGYKRTSLMRRVRHRMAQAGVEEYGDYIDHLQVNADEFSALFNTIPINVTDVDDEALTQARHASYVERDLRAVPDDLAAKYFEQQNGRYSFRKDLRRTIIFGRNDLVQDAPISRIDLLVCRNTLMYFNQETQAKILARFHFALVPNGVLFLGKAEMLLSHSRVFDAIDLKRRIFSKSAGAAGATTNSVMHPTVHDRRVDVRGLDELRERAFSASPVPQVVVTADDVVALADKHAETMFGVTTKDIGRPLRDLDLSYRPIELRGYVEQARLERRSLRIKDVEWPRGGGEALWFEVHVNPLVGSDNKILGISVVFHDVTAARRLMEDLEYANRQLESAYEELQSTNEELETMNEELQSTNDELQTINDALRERTAELDQVNEFLESILTSLRAGVVVLDVQMRVLAWNRGAEELWGIRRDETIGEHLLNLDIGLPVAGRAAGAERCHVPRRNQAHRGEPARSRNRHPGGVQLAARQQW